MSELDGGPSRPEHEGDPSRPEHEGDPSRPLDAHPRVAALLGGPIAWHTLEHHEQVGSTNDVALARARAGMPPGLVVTADRQTDGRGRAGRGWDDGPGPASSLLVSAVAPLPDRGATLVPLAAGLATADALRRAGVRPNLKWPNDVMLGDAKCAGVLVERHQLDAGEVAVVGIGIDVDWRGTARDTETASWSSVAEETGGDVDRGEVLADLLRGLAMWLRSVPADPMRLLIAYRAACATIDRDVQVDFPDGDALIGRATDLDRDGRLVVTTDGGVMAVNAGDVHHLCTPRLW